MRSGKDRDISYQSVKKSQQPVAYARGSERALPNRDREGVGARADFFTGSQRCGTSSDRIWVLVDISKIGEQFSRSQLKRIVGKTERRDVLEPEFGVHRESFRRRIDDPDVRDTPRAVLLKLLHQV